MNAYELPHKLSELAQIALEDVKAVELKGNYRVVMGAWHDPERGRCAVCAAGAVMAQRLGADPARDYWPYEFGGHNAKALFAIDYLRQGEVGSALGVLSGKADWSYEQRVAPSHKLDRDMPAYESGDYWRTAMEKLAADLREAGL